MASPHRRSLRLSVKYETIVHENCASQNVQNRFFTPSSTHPLLLKHQPVNTKVTQFFTRAGPNFRLKPISFPCDSAKMTTNADCWLLSTPGWWSLINLQKDSLWGSTMLNTNIIYYIPIFINFQAMWTVGTGNCKAPKREQLCVEQDENTKHIARCSNMFNHKVWQKQTMLAQVSKWPNQGSNCGSLSGNRWHSNPPQQNAIKASYTAIEKSNVCPKWFHIRALRYWIWVTVAYL